MLTELKSIAAVIAFQRIAATQSLNFILIYQLFLAFHFWFLLFPPQPFLMAARLPLAFLSFALVVLTSLLALPVSNAATINWVGSNSQEWTDAANWDPAQLPGANGAQRAVLHDRIAHRVKMKQSSMRAGR